VKSFRAIAGEIMFRLNLGGGAVAFESEAEADHVVAIDPAILSGRQWPAEVVENIRRYQVRLTHPAVGLSDDGVSGPTESSLLSNSD
jgi:hypothetical protein